MAAIKPILRTKVDYEAARARIDALRDSEPGSTEGDELAVLGDLVALYESRHIRMEYPNLRQVEGRRENPRETQADEWAEEALILREIWETSTVRDLPTIMAVMSLATGLRIHPAIVAGRVRYERENYRLLSLFVGTGEIRNQFGVAEL